MRNPHAGGVTLETQSTLNCGACEPESKTVAQASQMAVLKQGFGMFVASQHVHRRVQLPLNVCTSHHAACASRSLHQTGIDVSVIRYQWRR